MEPTFPPGVSAAQFNAAIAEYRRVLGDEDVIVEVERLVPYTRTMLATPLERHQPSGALVPESVEEIQQVLAICNKYKIPVWPISTGRNYGYGAAAPATAGQMVLDLRKLNRIIEVDAELGTALVEPGVSYVQLSEYLKANNIPYWPSFPSSGGLAGPMGNILERGAGYNRTGEHAANFCGMEVVLADGTVLRTGMGGVENTTAWQAYRWGFGPWTDGLFLQSNFGIVTKIGVWLMRRPPAHLFFIVGYPDLESMGRGIDVMRDLRLQNILETGIIGTQLYSLAATTKRTDIYDGPGSIPADVLAKYYADNNLPPFATLSVLYGTEEQIAVNFEIVKTAFATTGGQIAWGSAIPADSDPRHWERNMIGEPNVPEFAIYNFRGGGGSMWFAPVVPARGHEVVKVFTMLDTIFRKHGFDVAGGLLVYGRHLDMVVDLLFDRTDAEETLRAHACFAESLDACTAAGYGLYRTNTAFMEQAAAAYGPVQMSVNKRLKQALDPNGIIAPGKCGIYI
jgi:4-cresol dehydrogenase (hydroxylating)